MANRAANLHSSPWRGVVLLTGGGSGFLSELLSEPGASATLLDAQIPYAEAALAELLGGSPDQACSDATARSLAMAAFQRARRLAASSDPDSPGQHVFGFGCTASLATRRAKKGAHRAHVAIQTASETFNASFSFNADRATEEQALVEGIWDTLAHALALTGSRPAAAEPARTTAPTPWQQLILGAAHAHPTAAHDGRLLLPGAFNPLHEGHLNMLQIAEQITGLQGAFELSVANVDKPFLDFHEIERRLAQFERPAWLTRLPTFLDKARHFPAAHFAIGVDTLIRIADPRYYGSDAGFEAALAELAALDTRFVVFGRDLPGGFHVLEDVAASLPELLASRCVPVDASTFRNPESSSRLRQKQRRR